MVTGPSLHTWLDSLAIVASLEQVKSRPLPVWTGGEASGHLGKQHKLHIYNTHCWSDQAACASGEPPSACTAAE